MKPLAISHDTMARPVPASTASIVERVRAGIAADIEEIPTLAELASTAKMSRYTFSRHFRKHIGTGVREYVRQLRLARACELLANSSRSITRTAIDCGFYDLSHFDRVFARHFGITPREFRQRYTRHAVHARRVPPAATRHGRVRGLHG